MQEELIDLQNDSNFKSVFEYNTILEEFWCKKLKGHGISKHSANSITFPHGYVRKDFLHYYLSKQHRSKNSN